MFPGYPWQLEAPGDLFRRDKFVDDVQEAGFQEGPVLVDRFVLWSVFEELFICCFDEFLGFLPVSFVEKVDRPGLFLVLGDPKFYSRDEDVVMVAYAWTGFAVQNCLWARCKQKLQDVLFPSWVCV